MAGPAAAARHRGWRRRRELTAEADEIIAHELSVTLYDTADVYGLGHSERLLGRLLRDVRRDELVISSKVGYFAFIASLDIQLGKSINRGYPHILLGREH